VIAKKHLDEIERLFRLIDFHHGRLASPPQGCVNVHLWEMTEAFTIARLVAELRPLLRSTLTSLSQSELQFSL
jgi:hypothetical protein